MSVFALLLVIGIPSYIELSHQHRLSGIAHHLYSDVQYARSEAIKRSDDNLTIRFFSSSGSWCYRVTDLNGTQCHSCAVTCDIGGDGVTRGGDSSDFPDTNISINYASDVLGIGARRGTMSSGSIDFIKGSDEISVITSGLGRVRICTRGSTSIMGISSC